MHQQKESGRRVGPPQGNSPSATSTTGIRRHTAIQYGLLLVTATICVWIQHHHLANEIPVPITPTHPIQAIASDLSAALTPLVSTIELSANEDEVDAIVRRAYGRTYAKIPSCTDNISGEECIAEAAMHFKSPGRDKQGNAIGKNNIPSIPWWFQTLLRDLPESGVYGYWTEMNAAFPPIQFCTIPKVATTEWQKIFCILNNDRNKVNCSIHSDLDDDDSWECWTDKCIYTNVEKGTLPANTPKAVIVRDPLERLLSAYLNKCHDSYYRLGEQHCEPIEIFGQEYNKIDMLDYIQDNDQQLFEAYLDVMPLSWNIHFIPQAFTCDLYRRIDQYDFIGNMDGNFMSDLDKMANRFGGRLPILLDKFFGYKNHTRNKHINVGSDKGHGTKAPEKVAQFYTPRSLRRALEYVSIDYVVLGLRVPEWARQMLKEDV